MYLLFNGQFTTEQELRLPLTNRAFQYNDGFFETVMVVNGKLRFWDDHLKRMQEAAHCLNLSLPFYFNQPRLENELLQLAEENNALQHGRLKLKVWRAGAGLYTPETNDADWLASVQSVKPIASESIRLGICKSIRTVYSPLSHFKGPNAPVYTLAGIEKAQTGFDDMLLLSSQGAVAECISSNLFWVMEKKLFTPALDTGCVNGIARRNILAWCNKRGIKTHEAYFVPERLLDAHAVFTANVTGIRPVHEINGQSINKAPSLLTELASLFETEIPEV